LTVRPAIAALPTITPVGMAALLPGASAGFSVVESKNKLAADVEGSVMVNSSERMKFLKAKVPGATEMLLGKLLSEQASRLKRSIDRASLVVVRSQEIDSLGENVDELTARAAMEGVIGNVARAIRKLATAGVENFVVTADHGHQFSMRKEEDMKTDSPGGSALDVHRRCWTGHGGATPPGCVRVSGADLGYDTNLEFVFPKGLGVFKAGGGLTFHHGGASLQELVIPVVSLRIPSRDQQVVAGSATELRDVPDKVTNRTFVVGVRVSGDLFADERRALRLVLVSEGQQVGHAGMAIGGELDRSSHVLHMDPNSTANVGMVLTSDDCASLRIVVQDPKTDAVLDRSGEIPVSLGI
ncbi:MAG: PglZ domain-containing protein, partial [Chloroflexota bacterium]|nr:PglZ domain-containing protein [Chloroflexota bacterium]